MFSGGSYEECARWLWNFLTSHAKRADPRVEVELEAGTERGGMSYAARLRFGARTSAPLEFDYADIAAKRGSLAWCTALADRVRTLAGGLVAGDLNDARAR